MASNNRVLVVNFGSTKAGLSTVGYALYNADGTVHTASTTSGVTEIGTSTGIYAVEAPIPEGFTGIVLWTTGQATPRYAAVETFAQLNQIQEETDRIRAIWNSLKNQGNVFSKIMDRLGLMQKNKGVQLPDIKKAVATAIKGVKMPEAKEIKIPELPAIPDYSPQLAALEAKINKLDMEVGAVPKTQKDYGGNFRSLQAMLERAISRASAAAQKDSSQNANRLIAEMRKIQGAFTRLDALMARIRELQARLDSMDENDKDMVSAKRSIQAEIQRLNVLFNMLATTGSAQQGPPPDMMLAFGARGVRRG